LKLSAVVAAACLSASVTAAPAQAMTIGGARLDTMLASDAGPLQLIACGVRQTLWIRHYALALYAPPGSSALAVRDPHTPKAMRMHVLQDRFLPDNVPEKWREPLRDALQEEQMTTLDGVFASLSTGDVLTVKYVPQQGVSLEVNDTGVGSVDGHDLVDAMLEAWAQKEAIGDKIERFASKSRC
jgi:hypothetical protein